MKKIFSLILTLAILLTAVMPAMARTPEQINTDVQYLYNQIKILKSNNQQSNANISSVFVDLSSLNSKTVTETVYSQGNVSPIKSNTFKTPQLYTQKQAEQKILQYVLGNIANIYRAEPLNTEITGYINQNENSVQFYVYGPQTMPAIEETYIGVPNCFPIEYDRSSGHSHSKTPIIYPVAEEIVKKIDTPEAKQLLSKIARTAIFTINNTSFALDNTTVTMDVSPYVKDEHTYVPVRYLAYAIGAKKTDITWVQDTQQVIISKNDITIKMTIGSTIMLVNNSPVIMDVAPEITNNRTMLPARYLAEAMGAKVDWNQDTTQATITVPEQ